MGHAAQSRMQQSDVLIVGMRGVGVEIGALAGRVFFASQHASLLSNMSTPNAVAPPHRHSHAPLQPRTSS